jgi:transposase
MDGSTMSKAALSGLAAKSTPFSQQIVSLTKQEHVELVAQLRYWRSAHERATRRIGALEEQLAESQRKAAEREAALRTLLEEGLEKAKGEVRDLKHRLFGRKSEKGKEKRRGERTASRRRRGQQPGSRGHGRTRLPHLPVREEMVGIDAPQCPACGMALLGFPGTEDSEVIEIEVHAHRRLIRRKRYRCSCGCGALPGIVTAPAPPQLIAGGKFGISVWVMVLLDKFLYGRPSQRLLSELTNHGLPMAAGSLAGGLKTLAPLFVPLYEALRDKLRSEPHWHADETRWNVFVDHQGKVGHRWWLWVFHSKSVVHFVIDPSRSAEVIEQELSGVEAGIISADRYRAYQKHSRLHPGVRLSYCWAHQRRDALMVANDHPTLESWAMDWVDRIGQLFHLRACRAATTESRSYAAADKRLRRAVQAMAELRDKTLADRAIPTPARKLMESLKYHWSGLTTFVDHPDLPMDNNKAERALRTPVVGRKDFYGSGSNWSATLAATMYSLLLTVRLWGLNEHLWLTDYLTACALNGGRAPSALAPFLPWVMDAQRLDALRANHRPSADSS